MQIELAATASSSRYILAHVNARTTLPVVETLSPYRDVGLNTESFESTRTNVAFVQNDWRQSQLHTACTPVLGALGAALANQHSTKLADPTCT
jgi:hypothetical protein